ncbi:peptidase E [Schumannella luteola]|uniref:Dipeptidase E n=1 Tax=Schumannella luteola TaxID=472059 RepID=A0A852YE73_9MICO|nr:Type 1 glutamine amidotransferase-like domain-containing protein [Schumannella luteola]NYG97418.1 dipeptidase E [Schumannella luteola]
MRLMLCSGLVHEGPTLDALVGLLGKPIAESRIVVVIDAMLPFPGDKSTMLGHLDELKALGWAELDILTLFSGPSSGIEQRLRDADVIFGYGGTNHWLAHAWRASGLAPVLRELLDEKVYVGFSAGSMIFSRRHAEVVDAFDDHEEVRMLGLDQIDGGVGPALPLVDWMLLPHLGADFFPHATDEWAAEAAAKFPVPLWFLDDDSALIVRDPDTDPEPVGGHWLRFADGELVDAH